MDPPGITIRPVGGKADVEVVVELTLNMFPEEARATGMSLGKWRDIHIEELLRQPWLWPQCGRSEGEYLPPQGASNFLNRRSSLP